MESFSPPSPQEVILHDHPPPTSSKHQTPTTADEQKPSQQQQLLSKPYQVHCSKHLVDGDAGNHDRGEELPGKHVETRERNDAVTRPRCDRSAPRLEKKDGGWKKQKKSWLRNKYSRGVHDCEVAENAHKPYQQYHQLHKEGLRRTKGQLGVAICVGMLRRPKFDRVVVRA